MKRSALLAILLLASPLMADDEGIRIKSIPFMSQTVHPGDAGIVLLAAQATNRSDDAVSLRSITVTCTGEPSCIAPQSVRLYTDQDGNWWTGADRALVGTAQSFEGGKASFDGIDIALPKDTPVNFIVSADVFTKAAEGQKLDAEIASAVDIVTSSASCSGEFPIDSIKNTEPHCIDVTATALSVQCPAGDMAAGKSFQCTVSCLDAYGNSDTGWNESSLTFSGVLGNAPGTSPSGFNPEMYE